MINSSFRNPEDVKELCHAIHRITTRSWNIMEVCGGQTHALAQYGIEDMLPQQIRLIHGPGCPVCVTPVSVIDNAIRLSMQPGVCLCTFGDMMRVPGTLGDLQSAKSRGGGVKMFYSPLDALQLAAENPHLQVVFLALGFETALPMYALVLQTACQRRIRNFSLLPALDSVLPAMDALLSDPENVIDGFLAAGHVCAVTGIREYESFSRKWQTPVAVTGFEPSDLLYGILWCVRRLEANQPGVDNAYSRVVELSGNEQSLRRIRQVFERSDQEWRGLGMLKGSGFKINEAYKQYDAVKRFQLKQEQSVPDRCQAGKILSGKISPHGCPLFGQACTPNHPLGAPMVSSEGTCAAYYRYKRNSYDRNPVKASLSVTRYSL